MDDIDGTQNNKTSKDINGLNGSGRSYEGYVRGVTGNGMTGGFIDVAVAWSYLTGSDSGIADANRLKPGQTWSIAMASISQANDANGLSQNTTDLMGISGGTGNDISSGPWSADISAVPEIPASPWFVLGFIGLVVFGGRFRSSAAAWVHRKAH